MAVTYEVVNGPSKMELMLAVFDGTAADQRIVDFYFGGDRVPFTDRPRKAFIDGAKRNGDESWIITGRINFIAVESPIDREFEGIYGTKTRRGLITLLPD